MNTGLRLTAHYDGLERWGRPPNAANRQRLACTHSLIPRDVRTVLDVGCGDGTSSDALVARGLRVVGVDISRSALGFVTGLPVVGSAADVPFADNAFDLVMALEVIEHLPRDLRRRALAEMARVARRHIVVSTPNQECLAAGRAQCPACGAIFHRNMHFHTFDAHQHAALFRGSGFTHRVSHGVGTWRPSCFWTRVRHTVGGAAACADMLSCPRCGRIGGVRQPPGLLRRGLLRLVNGAAWRLTRPVPLWLVSRYDREGGHVDPSGAPVRAAGAGHRSLPT